MMGMRTQHTLRFLCFALALGTALAPTAQAQGLFGGLLSSKPALLELTDSADKGALFIKAFSDSGALARDVKRADFAERKVVIASFQIEFATEQVGQAESVSGSSAERIYTLLGVTDERMQAMTDGAYAAFVETLKKRGYEVLPTNALDAGSFKPELANVDKPPVKKERGTALKVLKAGGGTRSELDKDNISIIATAKGTAPDVWGGAFKTPTALKVADELGAATIQLRLKVNFSRMDDAGTAGNSGAKPKNTLGTQTTRMQVFAPGAKWSEFALKRAVILPNSAADKAVEVGSTGGEKTAAVASGAASVLFGFLKGGISGAASAGGAMAGQAAESGNFTVTADANYDTNTSKDIALALEMMAEALPK
jgi:hypothetical protein